MTARARMFAAVLVVLVMATAATLLFRDSPAESEPDRPRERGPNAEEPSRDAGRAVEEAPAPGIPAADPEPEPDATAYDLPGDEPDEPDTPGGDDGTEEEAPE